MFRRNSASVTKIWNMASDLHVNSSLRSYQDVSNIVASITLGQSHISPTFKIHEEKLWRLFYLPLEKIRFLLGFLCIPWSTLTFCFKFSKSNLYDNCVITPEACNENHLCGIAPGQHSCEETSQWWWAISDTVTDLTGQEIEPQTSCTNSDVLTTTPKFTHS